MAHVWQIMASIATAIISIMAHTGKHIARIAITANTGSNRKLSNSSASNNGKYFAIVSIVAIIANTGKNGNNRNNGNYWQYIAAHAIMANYWQQLH